MAPYEKDENLGIKHKQLNTQIKDAIANGKLLGEKEFTKAKTDLENLQKIDIASYNRDIEYIISVLKSDDLLYVSRAIKRSIWLVEDQYESIINPQYLNEHIFPLMKTKAAIKLLKHIRQHLKTERRVEEFYENETNPKIAAKWLSRCSVPFIEVNISKHTRHLSNLEFKRIYTRSVTIFEAAVKNENCMVNMKAASFLLRTHTDKYLDVFEYSDICSYGRMSFGATATDLLMKKAPERVITNFLKYIGYIHISTFINNMKREKIKEFVIRIVNNIYKEDKVRRHRFSNFLQFDVMRQFVERMPKEEQFEFVKQVFLNREDILAIPDDTLQRGTDMFAFKKLCLKITEPKYEWYVFASFDIAFEEIKKLIKSETDYISKYAMLKVLLKCAGKNNKNLLTLLIYYFKISLKDDIGVKKAFIKKIIAEAEVYKTDEEIWKVFVDIIENIYASAPEKQKYSDIILLRDVINGNKVQEKIEKDFTFHTYQNYRQSLDLVHQNKLFEFLYNYLVKKTQSHNITTEDEFNEAVSKVQNFLSLLVDWEKELADFPFVLDKIKELIGIRKENAWKTDLSSIYNKKKSWKRLMFEESVVLYPSQKVCLNALKHDPSLLVRYESDVDMLSSNDAVCLKQLLRKIRIYWPDTLSDVWSKTYLARLQHLGNYKALTKGLCTLLSQDRLLGILKGYAPLEPKIDWNNTNELTLSLQRFFSKTMHIARPQPPADAILMYAKGDFLQYALPSLLAIYYNMGRVESQEHIPKLLNARVSLQKHGLRFAFIKLKHTELKFHLSNVWQATKNISIRAVTFVLLFDLMCKEKDEERAKELWQILEVFIDNLSFTEDKKIYQTLDKIENVPQSIKPKFLVKSFTFLKTLLPHIKIDSNAYEYSVEKLALYTRDVMETMDSDFVENLIAEYLNNSFFKSSNTDGMLGVISSFLLCAKDEETQIKKYEIIFSPLITRVLTEWNQEEKHFVKNNFQSLITHLYNDLFEYVIKNSMVIPTKIFQRIGNQLNALALPPNYIIIRKWQLIVKLTEIMEKVEDRENWEQKAGTIAPEFGKFCLEILRDDVKTHFPCIYVLFGKVLKMTVRNNLSDDVCLPIYEVLLSENDFIQAHLVVIQVLNERGHYTSRSDESDELEKELKRRIREHPSVEVRMHYYSKYDDEKQSLGI